MKQSTWLSPVWLPWWLAATVLLVLYIPTLISLYSNLWSLSDQSQGPVVLCVGVWLIWRRWPELVDDRHARPRPGWAVALFALSLLAYVLGRSQGIWLFEVGSMVGVLTALVLQLRGAQHLRVVGFALFFLCFLPPLPEAVVSALTQPMKMAVSYVAEAVLYRLGYPISRTGVILQIGQYQMLVADACAGLHTLFTLEALGLLYLNVVHHASVVRNIALAILIVPISFLANVIRVIVLTLVTYYFGDAAGQGFLHSFAGIVLFLSALLLILGVDALLRLVVSRRQVPTDKAAT